MMKIDNANFICPKMSLNDIKQAFGMAKEVGKEVNKLVGSGLLRKVSDRHYAPTEELLDMAFLPDVYTLEPWQVRYLTLNATFYYGDLVRGFNHNEQVVKWLIKYNWVLLHADKRYRKSQQFDDFLIEGEINLIIRGFSHDAGECNNTGNAPKDEGTGANDEGVQGNIKPEIGEDIRNSFKDGYMD